MFSTAWAALFSVHEASTKKLCSFICLCKEKSNFSRVKNNYHPESFLCFVACISFSFASLPLLVFNPISMINLSFVPSASWELHHLWCEVCLCIMKCFQCFSLLCTLTEPPSINSQVPARIQKFRMRMISMHIKSVRYEKLSDSIMWEDIKKLNDAMNKHHIRATQIIRHHFWHGNVTNYCFPLKSFFNYGSVYTKDYLYLCLMFIFVP